MQNACMIEKHRFVRENECKKNCMHRINFQTINMEQKKAYTYVYKSKQKEIFLLKLAYYSFFNAKLKRFR